MRLLLSAVVGIRQVAGLSQARPRPNKERVVQQGFALLYGPPWRVCSVK